MTSIRDAVSGDLDDLARLWFDSWQDAHAELLPKDLIRARTPERFRERLERHAVDLRLAVRDADVCGFSLILGDELNPFYVARGARGSVASRLMADAL